MNAKPNRSTPFRAYQAWDRTTRWFHWINALCVLALMALGLTILNAGALGVSGAGKLLLKELHVYVGYVFCLNLLWRVIWAWVGTPSARWASLVPGRQGYMGELRCHLHGLIKGQAPRYLGHNPLGRLMVSLLLILMVTQAATGLVLAGTDLYKAPFGGLIAQWVTDGDPEKLAQLEPGSKDFVDQAAYDRMRAYRKPVVTVHEIVFYILLVAVLLHVLGVLVGEIREEGGLVSAMFSGRKFFSAPPLDGPEPLDDATGPENPDR